MFGRRSQDSNQVVAERMHGGGFGTREGHEKCQELEMVDGDHEVPELGENVVRAHFAEDGMEAKSEAMSGPARLTPVPMTPPEGPSAPFVAEHSPLTMTALQQLVAADGRVGDLEQRERSWIERRRTRRSERLLLNAALMVTGVLISGAFAFVKLEDSVASSRHQADRQWLMARNEHRAAIEAENREALAAAARALTQPKWTDLLSHVKDGRRLLSEIRDHFSEWSYAPFHDPELAVLGREEDDAGVLRVLVRVDGSKEWASTIVMQKVDGVFKLDWPSFQRRFDRAGHVLEQGSRMANRSVGGNFDFGYLLKGGDAYLGTFPTLSLDQALPAMNLGETAYLGMTADTSE